LTKGDVQIANISAAAQLQFSKWAPAGTQSNVQLIITNTNTTNPATVTFTIPPLTAPSQYYGTETLENYVGTPQGGTFYFPVGVSRLHYNFSTIDCGGNIEIQPLDRPREATKVQSVAAVPSTTGAKQGEIRFVATSPTGAFYGFNGTSWTELPSLVGVPSTSTSTGIPGQMAFDSGNIYVCVATNTWRKSTLSTF
jgi:hypothetical protein